ncbi:MULTISPECIES: hypothetical protein [unclassified Guyparkeria]|uniref:hypothetical protein n=1 Tax=unclassified Guyparkeria TaxID=2626246 RepID=UPI0007334B71|nr:MULTISPECIES: hypothetical protein [unclassified Guyparkeria]KTG15907.1 hypothetical protein AUR63_06215 [Guyparkeria sp. XI15]OAE84657.1 hypothetical protein AWR35_06225 [Guyparkeria sp. WRN-7]
MRNHSSFLLATLVGSLLPFTVTFADGLARFSTGDPNVPTLTFSWQDTEHSRLDSPNQPAHVLAIDGKAWGVASVAGQPVSMDLESLAKLLGQESGLTRLGPDTVVPAQLTTLERTDRTETVAGIQGEVYRVSWQDSNGRSHIDEAVFTGDALVQEMQTALVGGMSQAIARGTGVAGHEQAHRELQRRGLAVLRFGDDFRLESIERGEQPDHRFALPSKPVDLRQMMRGMIGG